MEEEKNVEQTTEKTAEETTEENKKTETSEKKEETSTETEETTKETKEEVDYKAELETAQKNLNKQDSIIKHKEGVIKELQKENNTETEETVELEETEDKFVEFKKEQDKKMDDFQYSQVEDKIEEEISSLAKSEDEAELVRFKLKNNVKFGYTLKEVKDAVKSAWLMANEKKILNTNTELAEALKSKSSMTTTANTSSESIQEDSDKLSGDDKKLVDKFAKRGKEITDSAPR